MIKKEVVEKTINLLLEKGPENKSLLSKGVQQIASLWKISDGDEEKFSEFCMKHYIFDPQQKKDFFLRASDYLEIIQGYFNAISLGLQRRLHEDRGPLDRLDEWFASYAPYAHLQEDLYTNKIAFLIALNFPEQTLKEKEECGNDRMAWAYARLGDIFTSRIPPSVQQTYATVSMEADMYISEYKINTGYLLKDGQSLFPKNKILISHWGLRDEIKANYNQGAIGFDRQQTLCSVMQRIIFQEVPIEILHSDQYQWDPFYNILYQNRKKRSMNIEKTIRYEKLIRQFKALQSIDQLTGETHIHRHFSKEMGVSVEETENLFKKYLLSDELQKIGQIIAGRLGRKLSAFDVWYDGFRATNRIRKTQLNQQINRLYPNAQSFEKDIPSLLQKLGFHSEQASSLAKKIIVSAARGSGHAWGASMKGQKSHLRTPIHITGMDYEGYNTAIHELGHNVEQIISLYNVDYYLLNGVPNIAFTEALAFIFQKRDIELLGIHPFESFEEKKWNAVDTAWSLYEIIGVSLLDIYIWKWLYKHPGATAEKLKKAVLNLSKTIWNKYFSTVFELRDQYILAIYSHIISYPLYLSSYAYGKIAEFQIDKYLQGKNFAKEIDRIFRLGCLSPSRWMQEAIGQPLSISPLKKAIKKILNE